MRKKRDKKFCIMILAVLFTLTTATSLVQAAAPTAGEEVLHMLQQQSAGGTLWNNIMNMLYERLVGPFLHTLPAATPTVPEQKPVTPATKADTTAADNQTTGTATAGLLSGKVVALDPGHGGSNPGAVAGSLHEADINLAVAKRVQSELLRAGAQVVMTRDSDRNVASQGASLAQELAARLNISREKSADIFVSLHTNSNPNPAIAGAMTFYPRSQAADLANAIQTNVIQTTQAVNKRIETADFYVLRNAERPAVLVEMGFITNQAEAAKLADSTYQQKLASGIAQGIISYFSAKP